MEVAAEASGRSRGDGESEADDPPGVMVVRHESPVFFWLGFMSIVLVATLVLVAGARVLDGSERMGVLWMPAGVRAHFEAGRLVKVEVGGGRSAVKAFVRAGAGAGTALLLGPSSYSYRNVIPLLAARGIRAVAVDLPGAGLAEKKSYSPVDAPGVDRAPGFLQVRLAALKELLVEGMMRADKSSEHEFLEKLRSATTQGETLALGPGELGDAVDQIVASLGLASVHLVMHDTGAEAGLAWASQNPAKVASITLVDSLPRSPSLPLWLFRIPVLGRLVAHSDFAFRCVLRSCCFASVTAEGAEEYGYLLRSGDGLQALLAASNSSMDVAEWAGRSSLESTPKQILWASGWSKNWQREGEQLAAALPAAAFHSHHGSRWPQEDVAPEIAELIAEFVKSLPSSVPHYETLFELAQDSGDSRSKLSQEERGRGFGNHYSHKHGLGYMEGLGVGHGGWVL